MIRKILKSIFVIFWMVLIFTFSMDTGAKSTKKSDGIIIHTSEIILRRKLTTKEKQTYIEKYQIYVRKTAHFTVYFCLGFSLIWLWMEFHPLHKKDVLLTILFIFLYACSDEIHQLFVEERSGEITDILLDTIGGSVSTILTYILNTRKKHKNI